MGRIKKLALSWTSLRGSATSRMLVLFHGPCCALTFCVTAQTLWVIWRKYPIPGILAEADAIVSSFGGGFELMKTGGKNDGVRPIIETAAQYVSGHYWRMLAHLISHQYWRNPCTCNIYLTTPDCAHGSERFRSTYPRFQQRKGFPPLAKRRKPKGSVLPSCKRQCPTHVVSHSIEPFTERRGSIGV